MNLKDFLYSWGFHLGVIFFTSIVIGFFLGQKVPFSSETLYWMTSTIVQAFGALIAIILVIGIRHYEVIDKNYLQSIKGLNVYFKTIEKGNLEAWRIGLEKWNEIQEERVESKQNIISKLGGTIQSVVFLIGWALIMLMFTNYLEVLSITHADYVNSLYAMASTFLVITSFYCLQSLIFRIASVLAKT